ncbi:hypothetical protein Tco_0287538 [Tanacetum coccineum]
MGLVECDLDRTRQRCLWGVNLELLVLSHGLVEHLCLWLDCWLVLCLCHICSLNLENPTCFVNLLCRKTKTAQDEDRDKRAVVSERRIIAVKKADELGLNNIQGSN